jgi:hypothetical protein
MLIADPDLFLTFSWWFKPHQPNTQPISTVFPFHRSSLVILSNSSRSPLQIPCLKDLFAAFSQMAQIQSSYTTGVRIDESDQKRTTWRPTGDPSKRLEPPSRWASGRIAFQRLELVAHSEDVLWYSACLHSAFDEVATWHFQWELSFGTRWCSYLGYSRRSRVGTTPSPPDNETQVLTVTFIFSMSLKLDRGKTIKHWNQCYTHIRHDRSRCRAITWTFLAPGHPNKSSHFTSSFRQEHHSLLSLNANRNDRSVVSLRPQTTLFWTSFDFVSYPKTELIIPSEPTAWTTGRIRMGHSSMNPLHGPGASSAGIGRAFCAEVGNSALMPQ